MLTRALAHTEEENGEAVMRAPHHHSGSGGCYCYSCYRWIIFLVTLGMSLPVLAPSLLPDLISERHNTLFSVKHNQYFILLRNFHFANFVNSQFGCNFVLITILLTTINILLKHKCISINCWHKCNESFIWLAWHRKIRKRLVPILDYCW